MQGRLMIALRSGAARASGRPVALPHAAAAAVAAMQGGASSSSGAVCSGWQLAPPPQHGLASQQQHLTTSAAACAASAAAGPQGPSSGPRQQQQQQSSGISTSAASKSNGAGGSGGSGKAKRPRVPDNIGFIGAGQMGQALIMGFLKSGVSSAGRICACIKRYERREHLESLGIGKIFGDAVQCGGAAEVAAHSRIIFLGVKPQAMQPVLEALAPHLTSDHLIISIAAGIRIKSLEQKLGGSCRVVRVMPNTPALVQAGASAYALGTRATEEDAETVDMLLSSVGVAVRVEERMMDAVTGVSGSGPAFIYLVIEAMADGGVAAGLPRDTALALAAQTVAGAAQMVFSEDEGSILGLTHPGILKDRVASPAGTTIAGLTELESSGVRGAFIRAVTRAAKRAEELAG